MPELDQTAYPPHKPDSTSALDWTYAFVEANPEAADHKFALAMWFLNALRAGYRAGMSHSEFPDT